MNRSLPPGPVPPANGEGGDNDNPLAELIVRYLDGMASEEEARQLSRQLDGDARRQELFVRLARLHGLMSEWGQQMLAERRGDVWDLLDDQDDAAAPATSMRVSLDDAIVQPAIHESDFPESSDVGVLRPPIADPPRVTGLAGRFRWWMAAAAVVAMAGVILVTVHANRRDLAASTPPSPRVPPAPDALLPVPAPPAAVITASAAATLGDAPLTRAGTTLVGGQAIDLNAGAIEVTFDSGAVVAVTAPARFRVVDRNRMTLEKGSLAAHVPPSGIGFRVDGANLTVIDQGTDFGLRPSERASATELHVFQGAVDVSTVPAGNPTTGPATAQPVRVTGGTAVICTAGSPTPAPAKYTPEAFVRHIDQYRVTVALQGTATDVPFNSPDPKWTIAADPSGQLAKPRPVYAVEMRPTHFFAASAKSKWISTAPQIADAPSGRFTFRTTIVLPDFAPGTASVTGTFGADDKLVDVVVNGVSTAPAYADMISQVSRMQPVTLTLRDAPWRPGGNEVDVIVENNVVPKGVLNQTALNVSFTATYAPTVRRVTEGGARTDQSTPASRQTER